MPLSVYYVAMDKVVIVMPAYKELGNIERMITELFDKEFPKITGAEMHLLIVNDLSPEDGKDDGTGDLVRKLQKNYKNLHIIEFTKEGLGIAYVRGFRYAMDKLGADAVMEMDADGQHPPRFVRPMVEAYLAGGEYVIGSRYIKGGSIPKEWGLSRKLMSGLGNLFIRVVLLKPSLHDLTTGFRLMKVKGVLDQIDLENLMELRRFAYKVDLLYQCNKLAKKTVEVPLAFAARTKEQSKFNPKEMLATFKVAIILGIKDKLKIIRFGIVGFVGFLVNFLFIRVFRSLGFAEVISWGLATELAIINNYLFNNIWTFKSDQIAGVKAHASKFFQFNLTSAGAIVIQSILGPLGVKILGEQYDFLVLGVIVLFVVFPYNYLMANLVIWKTWDLKKLFKK